MKNKKILKWEGEDLFIFIISFDIFAAGCFILYYMWSSSYTQILFNIILSLLLLPLMIIMFFFMWMHAPNFKMIELEKKE